MLLNSDVLRKSEAMSNLMVENIETALTCSAKIFKDVQQIVRPFIAVNGKIIRSTWKGIKWELFKKNDVSVLQTALDFNKQTLNVVCSALTLLVHFLRDWS